MKNYMIYRLDHNCVGAYQKLYCSYNNWTETPNVQDYKLVYEAPWQGETPKEILEKFNVNKPENFPGDSLCISDVIAIELPAGIMAYFVDSQGFVELKHFFDEDLNTSDIRSISEDSRLVVEQNQNSVSIYAENGDVKQNLVRLELDGASEEAEPDCFGIKVWTDANEDDPEIFWVPKKKAERSGIDAIRAESFLVTQIDWDEGTDDLPAECIIPATELLFEGENLLTVDIEELADRIADYLSDEYGFCIKGFKPYYFRGW